jgi:hypothetical protein
VAADAPALIAEVASVWVRPGVESVVELSYETLYAEGNGNGNGKCLLLRIPAGALVRDAAGRALGPGDSVLVQVRLVDPTRFVFAFEPAGARFDAAHPPRLEVRYRWAAEDLNGDGVVDAQDARIRERFGFWHQERPGGPWRRVTTDRTTASLEAHANLTGFSQYALASD